jgi:hypothetical protein
LRGAAGLVVVWGFAFGVLCAHAAPLTYTSPTSILLSTPGVTLTIASGSVADILTVNATSVAVTLSSGTGGTFTLTSPRALSSSASGSGGILTQTCLSSVETDTVTQTSNSETYTLTPTGSACSSQGGGGGGGGNNNPPSSGVGVGGGGSAYILTINGGAATATSTNVSLSLYGTAAYTMEVSNDPTFTGSSWIPYVTKMPWVINPTAGPETVYVRFDAVSGTLVGSAQGSINLGTSASAPASSSTSSSTGGTSSVSTGATSGTSSSLAAQIAALEAELAQLQAQTAGQSAPSYVFTRDLTLGAAGADVQKLQEFLIAQNIGPAARKLAAHGTTKNFASLTVAALIEFQKSLGIKPASGYFGPITRAYINAHE